jgi:small-conductance mechanosensitive channel
MITRTYADAARTISLVLAAWLWLLPAVSAWGAEPVPASPAEAEPPPPSVIPIDEIAVRADALAGRLGELEHRLSDTALERRVEEELVTIEPEIASVQARFEATLDRRHGPTEVETLAASWESLDARLASEEAEIGERASQLSAWLLEVRDATERWGRTRAAARGAAAPDRVLRLAAEALRELRVREGTLEAGRNTALDLQGRIVEKRRFVAAGLERVDAMRDQLAASLLVRQDDPLWRARPTDEDIREELGEARRDLAEIGAQLGEHAGRHRERFFLQVLLVLGLAWGLSRARSILKRHAASSEAPEARSLPLHALASPWAAALLVGTLATPFLHPERVLGLQIVVLLVSIPVWVLVLGAMLPSALRTPLVGLAALALTDVVRLVVGGFELLAQGLLLAEFAVGLVGALRLRIPERLRQVAVLVGRSIWLRVLAGWVQLMVVAFGVGLLAALLGYSNLAARISLLAIWGSYLGAALVAGVRIVEAVAQSALLEGRLDGLRMVRDQRARVFVGVRHGVRALGFAAWIYLLLQAVQLWGPVRDSAATVLTARVEYGSFALSLGGVVAFGLTLWFSWLLARFVSFVLDQEVFGRVHLAPGVPFALTTFSRYAILVIGFLAALAMLGFSFDRVALLLSALGVGIGFGLQNVVNNFVSGAILLFERPLRAGDRVQLDDLLGEITHIGIRASRVRTFDGADVIVPNGDLISARVVNWTLSDCKRRITIPVGVAYGTRPREVIEILQQVVRDHPDVLDHPAAEALFRGFGDSSLDFEVRAFTESERGWLPVTSDLAVAISEALESAGITIPFPQRDLHLQNVRELGDALADAMGSKRRPDSD